MEEQLRLSEFNQVGFYSTVKSYYIFCRFTRVGAATEKDLVRTFVLTLGAEDGL